MYFFDFFLKIMIMLSLYINSGLTDFCFKITKKKWEGQSVSCLLQICILLPGIEY